MHSENSKDKVPVKSRQLPYRKPVGIEWAKGGLKIKWSNGESTINTLEDWQELIKANTGEPEYDDVGKMLKNIMDSAAKKDPELGPEIMARAAEIIEDGKALDYIEETFKTLHYGDTEINRVFSIAIGCQSIINVQGVQPTTTGETGQGKTASIRACCHLLPRDNFFEGSLSNKAIFYAGLKAGPTLFLDDASLTPDLCDVIKRSMSNFQSDTPYWVVNADRTGNSLLWVPKRTVWFLTSVDTQGDEQFSDRQFPTSISNSPQANQEYDKWRKSKDINGEEDYPINESVLICRAIYREIKQRVFKVRIPYAGHYSFSDTGKRREMRYFSDFVRAVAVYHFRQRNPSEPDSEGIITIDANEEDFYEAKTYFDTNKDIRKHALTKPEKALIQFIYEQTKNAENKEVMESDLIEIWGQKTGDSEMTFRRKLQGRTERGTRGLIHKISGLSVTKITRNETERGSKIGSNGEAYPCDIPKQARHVNLIKCTWTPSLEEYADFVILDRLGWAGDPDNPKNLGK